MRPRAKPGFSLVFKRELRWLLRDRAALILIFVVPLCAFAVLTAVFSQPVIRELGIVVVDDDRSDTSRAFVEYVASSPYLSIVQNATDLTSATRAIRSGDAVAAIYIPANFDRDLKAQRRPQVVAFYNQQFLTAAGVAAQGLGDTLQAATRNVALTTHSAPAAPKIGTIAAETIVLVNPQKNYAQFLLRALLPAVLQVIIALSAAYSVGSEFGRRSLRTWLACAGGNPIVALAGKLAPLFIIFFCIMLTTPLIIEGLFELPFKGDVPMIVVAASLFIIAYLAIGALLQLLVRNLAIGLGLAGVIVSPAFGFAGVGFPLIGMNAFSLFWGAILPLRWFMAILFGQGARGLPVHDSAPAFIALAALAALYTLLSIFRLRSIARAPGNAAARALPKLPAVSPGIGGAFVAEWRRVLAIPGAFALFVLAPLVYSVYYPQPYLTQILRTVPIAVVDNDLSELSRSIVETLDASGTVKVAVRADTLAEARQAINRGEAFAAVGIPPGTQRDVLKGNSVKLPVYADATYLFLFRSTSSGIAAAINARSAELTAGGARPDGSLTKAALSAASPADILLQPIFNPVGGYASYIVPAAFILILQQTLLIGAAMLTTGALVQARSGPAVSVLGRGVAHLTISLPMLALYFIVLPRVYGFSALGNTVQLFTLASVFVLATSFMAQAAGAWFRHTETPTLIFLGTSLVQLFLTGFSWPREAIPKPVLAIGYMFPSDFAIDGVVRLNQLGASLWDVSHDWLGLWCLALLYFSLAVMSAHILRRRANP